MLRLRVSGGRADQEMICPLTRAPESRLGSSETGVHPDLDPLSLALFSCYHPHPCYLPFPVHSLQSTADLSGSEASLSPPNLDMDAIIPEVRQPVTTVYKGAANLAPF